MTIRRAVLVLAVVALALLAGCGGGGGGQAAGGQQQQGEEGEQQAAEPVVAGSFVGKADPSEHAFVAIVAGEAEEGAEGRDVRVYMCDPAREINEWFWGTVTGNTLDLTSEETGAKLSGELTAEAATGTVTLDDGRSFSFTANPATGFSGLYAVSVSSDGSFTGASETGGRVEGEFGPEGSVDAQHAAQVVDEGGHAVTGTLTAPDGEAREFEIGAGTFRPGGASEFDLFFIVSDTHIVGGTKQGKSGTSWSDPICFI